MRRFTEDYELTTRVQLYKILDSLKLFFLESRLARERSSM